MKRTTLILSGVLALQLVLALGLTFVGSDNSAFKAGEPLLALDKVEVDSIVIDETGGSSVTLAKKDGKWMIPAMAEFPADEGQVKQLIDKVAGLKKGWPVATTSEAAERFKVTRDTHERRIVFKGGEWEVGSLLVGTAPTYRQAHIRLPSSNEVYSLEFAAHDAPARNEQWMDKGLLRLPQDKVSSISVNDVTLEKKDGKFAVADVKEGETQKDVEIPPVVSAAVNPSFDAVQGKGPDALAKLEPADFQVTVKREGGDPVVYKFKKEQEGGAYLYSVSTQPYVFRVAESSVKPLAEANRAKLLALKQPEQAKQEPEAKEPPKPEEAKAAEPQPTPVPQPDSTGG
jgi:hypothetical protein